MKIRKWRRWIGKKWIKIKSRKKMRLAITQDNLRDARRPPEWMRELLFDNPDDGELAG